MALEDDPFGAASVEEQQWLDRNGYPNAAEWKALNSAAFSQLQDAAQGGDPMASVLVDQRRVFREGNADAVSSLLNRGAAGDVFALEMLASALESTRVTPDPVFATAVRGVAQLRGNNLLGLIPDGNLPRPLTPTQRIEAERRARELYRLLEETRRQHHGLPPFAPDPRPVRG